MIINSDCTVRYFDEIEYKHNFFVRIDRKNQKINPGPAVKVNAILLEPRHVSLYTCSLIRLAFAHEANTYFSSTI